MSDTLPDLTALTASRICHDLVSPVGAIANGLELMELAKGIDGPEFELVSQSAAHTSARLQFFRLAFGPVTSQQIINGHNLRDVLCAAYGGSVKAVCEATADMPRGRVAMLFLACLCVERALPMGGEIVIAFEAERSVIKGTGPKISPETQFWNILRGAPIPMDLPPAEVQFALLARSCERTGIDLKIITAEAHVEIAI